MRSAKMVFITKKGTPFERDAFLPCSVSGYGGLGDGVTGVYLPGVAGEGWAGAQCARGAAAFLPWTRPHRFPGGAIYR
ncbi:hypothetical protein CCP3SC15_1390014 [Gammaproteobacteria bacterium]